MSLLKRRPVLSIPAFIIPEVTGYVDADWLCRLDQAACRLAQDAEPAARLAFAVLEREADAVSNGTAGRVYSFSTDDIARKDRIPMWRDLFSRSVVKIDLQPVGDEPFRSSSLVHVLPDVTIRSSSASAAIVHRTRPLVADGDDNFVLAVMRHGRMMASQNDREVTIESGGAYLWSNATTGMSHNPTAMDLLTLSFSRRSLGAIVADVDAMLMRPLPAQTEALRLLTGYIDILQSKKAPMPADLCALSSGHIHDLAAMALGATRDAAEMATKGGVRAARLLAIKADILAGLTRPGLSVDAIAARHGVSPRHIRDLFGGEATTFTDFVREHRLRRAYRMLSDRTVQLPVSEVALSCGFGDLSYFNHSFRRRFGATPSDIRAGAGRDNGKS